MSQPSLTRTVEGFTITWDDLPIVLHLHRIRESSRGTTGELIVQQAVGDKARTITHQSINLLTSRARLAKELGQKLSDVPWDALLEQAYLITLRELRRGEPVESLEPQQEFEAPGFVLNPLLYEGNPTVLYGPGDSLKSFLSLYAGLLLANGLAGSGLVVAPTPWKVLYLDWEMSARDLRARVQLLRAGDDRFQKTPDYRCCMAPLADDIGDVKKLVTEGDYDVLILDSLAMAAGGHELERADSAIRFNAALRELNCTSLIIGHTPKPQDDQRERSLYGSVFFFNLCRVSWECRREGDILGIYQKKNNLGPKQSPMGFRIAVNDQQAIVEPADLTDDPALVAGFPLKDQIVTALKRDSMLSSKELADQLGAKQTSVRAKLNSYKGKLFTEVAGKWDLIPGGRA